MEATTPPCRAQWCTLEVVAVSAQTVGGVADTVRFVAAAMLDSPFLNLQWFEAGRRRGPVALAKETARWAGWTGPASLVAKARFVKLGYPCLVPFCCSWVEKVEVVGHLQMPALVRYRCGSNVRHHVSLKKRQLTASDRQNSTYNRPK